MPIASDIPDWKVFEIKLFAVGWYRLAQADIKTSPIAKPIKLGEKMKMKVERPAKAKLIATILVSPRRSDRPPPRRAPAPYRK